MSDTNGMRLSDDVPGPVRAFADTTNAGDSEAFVALFTADAFLSDGPGREFRGQEGVADWDRSDNIGQRSHFEVLGVRPGGTPQEVVATVVVTGDGFTGTSDLAFTLRGESISRLVIGP